MSAICGLIQLDGEPVPLEPLRVMAGSAVHGGSFGIEHCLGGEIGFAWLAPSAALSAGSSAPFASSSGGILLVADARLDNRPELLELLAAVGESLTDAELILAAYRRWGNRSCEHLLGDFAFAVWDAPRRELFCASDPLGIRPLHYAQVGPLFCFASQAQQILGHPAVPGRLDELTLGLYLCGEFPPDRTMFAAVRRLPAAHRMVAGSRGHEIERYWQVDAGRRTVYRQSADYAAHLRDLLGRSVSDRLRGSGETLGIAMSGGLDSTSVAALTHESLTAAEGTRRLVAGSFFFDRLTDCDERPYVRAMAAELDLTVEYVAAERFWMLRDSEACTPPLESPFMFWDGCFRELFRRLAEQGARVVLTGHGGDDVLGSGLVAERISWSVSLSAVRRAREQGGPLLPAVYSHLISPLLPDWVDRSVRRIAGRSPREPEVPAWIAPDFARRIDLQDRLRSVAPSPRRRIAARRLSPPGLAWLARHPAASWLDRLAAPLGLEVRHPFLDRRIIEFVLSIPLRQIVDPRCYKPLLRRAMIGLLPDSVRQRPDKSNLSSFLDFSMREKGAERIEELLRAPLAAQWGYLAQESLQQTFQDYRQGSRDEGHRQLWQAVTLELWLRRHGDRLGDGFRSMAGPAA